MLNKFISKSRSRVSKKVCTHYEETNAREDAIQHWQIHHRCRRSIVGCWTHQTCPGRTPSLQKNTAWPERQTSQDIRTSTMKVCVNWHWWGAQNLGFTFFFQPSFADCLAHHAPALKLKVNQHLQDSSHNLLTEITTVCIWTLFALDWQQHTL